MNVVVIAEASVSNAVAEALSDHSVRPATSVDAASMSASPPDVLVVSLSVSGVTRFVDTVDVPVIAITDGDVTTDEFCAVVSLPLDARTVQSALARAERVVEYQHAVDELYTLCRDRARGNEVSPRELREARYSARERLHEVNRSGIPPLKQLLR